MDQTTISLQLEFLREQLGHDSIQEFVDALNEWLKKPIPYATARRYHRDREPPVTYLLAVAHAFGVRLEWLVTGKGGMTEEEETARRLDAERSGFRDALESGDLGDYTTDAILPRGARLQLEDLVARHAMFAAWRAITGASGPADLYSNLERAITEPLEALGLPTTTGQFLDAYATDVALAIRRYARATKEEETVKR